MQADRRRPTRLALLALLALLAQTPAAAQTLGTPVYMAPYRAFTSTELGAALSDPGSGFALEGYYRYGAGKFDIGLRAGVISFERPDPFEDEVSLMAGADLRFRVIDHTEDFPLDGAFTGGIGGWIGDVNRLFIPIGLSLGRRVELEGSDASFVPYVHPVIAPTFGDGDSELLAGIGLGVDFKISRSIDIRVSGGIGDIDGIAIGLSWIR
jgi:hypothetical protein